MLLSQQKTCFVATSCRDKIQFVATKHVFVATKMILVAAPANDTRALVTVGTPDYILELLKEGNCASHNDGGNHTGSNTMPSAETYNVDNLAGNSG